VDEVGERLGPVDILVLNASTEVRRNWLDIDRSDFKEQVAVNLRASFVLLQATVPAMAQRGWGRVISIGSLQEKKSNSTLVVYAALKSAQFNMVLNLVRQYASRGVTLNNVAPGAIGTERNATVLADPAYRARIEAQIPMRRIEAPSNRRRRSCCSKLFVLQEIVAPTKIPTSSSRRFREGG
jgi:glucose 1-dehydrogenase